MSDRQKTCDELIEAGGKATARPWELEPDEDGDFYGVKSNHPVTGERDYFSVEDAAYVLLAANNAERLARMTQKLIDRLWKFSMCSIAIEHGDCAECREAFEKHLNRLWEESE